MKNLLTVSMVVVVLQASLVYAMKKEDVKKLKKEDLEIILPHFRRSTSSNRKSSNKSAYSVPQVVNENGKLEDYDKVYGRAV